MIRKSLLLGIAALMALGVFALGGDSVRAEVGAGSMTAMSIDMDPTGNTATSVGTIQNCSEVDAGSSATVNLTAQGIPAGFPMIAYQADVGMTDSVLNVTNNADTTGLISQAPGSNAFSGSEPVPGPGSDNIFNISAADAGPQPGSSESGDGVLSIMVIEVNAAAPDGIYGVSLNVGAHVDPATTAWEPTSPLASGRIVVGALTCASTFKQGDVDCSNTVTSVDALKILRKNASLSVAQAPGCAAVGTASPPSPPFPNAPFMGDVDCNNSVNSVDALKVLRFGAGLLVSQTEPCPDIGT